MIPRNASLTGRERSFGEDEIIVSKTDTRGRITYANKVFCRVSQFTEAELIGRPHNIVRHPHMRRCVFKFLWDTIQKGNEIFAYVVNRAKSGDSYWVFAHVTPTFDDAGRIVGYHSSRRSPDRGVVAVIKTLYQSLLAEEQRRSGARDAMNASMARLVAFLDEKKMSYEELIFSLSCNEAENRTSSKNQVRSTQAPVLRASAG